METSSNNVTPAPAESIAPSAPAASGTTSASSGEGRTLLMREIEPQIEEADVRRFFANYAAVQGVRIIRDRPGGQNHAYVEFPSQETAQAALDGLNGTPMPGTSNRFKLSKGTFNQRSQNPTNETQLQVSDLDPLVTDQMLSDLFSSRYRVDSVRISIDPVTKQSKCYGFVRFINAEEATRALGEMNGRFFLTRPLKLKPFSTTAAIKNSIGASQTPYFDNNRFAGMHQGYYGGGQPYMHGMHPPAPGPPGMPGYAPRMPAHFGGGYPGF